MLPSTKKPSHGSFVAWHAQTTPPPGRPYLVLSNNHVVASPELTFIQMASIISTYVDRNYGTKTAQDRNLAHLRKVALLIEVGNELCSSFYRTPFSCTGLDERTPVTTPRKIIRYADAATSLKGVKLARQAAKHLQGSYRSPAELHLGQLLETPYSLGGKTLVGIAPNSPVVTSEGTKYCDLYWPKQNVDAEYDSSLVHVNDWRKARDAERYNAIMASEVDVMIFTKDSLYKLDRFNAEAGKLAAKLGKRIRPRLSDYKQRQSALHKALLFAEKPWIQQLEYQVD